MILNATVSSATQMYSQVARDAIATYWPDGLIGAFSKSGSNYTTFSAIGGGTPQTLKAVGPITALATTPTVVNLSSVPGFANYATGGPVVSLDGGANNLAMILHFERHPAGGPTKFYSTLGVAKSTNGGAAWSCLATDLITLSHAYDAGETVSGQDIGGGPLAVVGSYYYCWFREYTGSSYATSRMSVARCLVTTFNAAVLAGTVPTFDKWQGGTTWGGSTGAVITALDDLDWLDVWYDTTFGVYLCVGVTNIAAVNAVIRIMASTDGLTWTNRHALTDEVAGSGEGIIYPTLIPNTFAGNRAGTGIWNLVYTYGTRWTANVVKYRTVEVTRVATFSFNDGIAGLANGTINWASDTIKARLVVSSVTPARHDTSISGYTAIGTDQTLTSKTSVKDTALDRAVLSAANPVFASPGVGNSIGTVVIYKFVTDDAHSIPLFCLELPVTVTDGTAVLIAIANTGLCYAQQ